MLVLFLGQKCHLMTVPKLAFTMMSVSIFFQAGNAFGQHFATVQARS